MIIDSFMFFNELDILEGRLEYLYDHVDHFIIVEGNITHSGKPKPLNFLENRSRYKKYLDKILYLPWTYDIDGLNLNVKPSSLDFTTDHWLLENKQRAHILEGLKFFPDDAIIMISDVDEIPNKLATTVCPRLMKEYKLEYLTLGHKMFVNNFDYVVDEDWAGTVITTNKIAKTTDPQWLRAYRSTFTPYYDAGWHLTYWGPVESISYKISSFAHQEYNNKNFTDPEVIKNRLKNGEDLFGRNKMKK